MNRLFTILCMVPMLVFHTSCNDSVMDIESPSVDLKTRAVDQRVQNLIQQARLGDVEAVAAAISITNVLNFEATSIGTASMSERVVKGRTRWFDKIAQGVSSAVEDNCDFFNEDER